MAPETHEAMVEFIRGAVKQFGKEGGTHRLTRAEKRAVAEIIYTYGNRGIRTNENEITRIALNYLIQEHKERGKESLLERVLQALNA